VPKASDAKRRKAKREGETCEPPSGRMSACSRTSAVARA
jgi:hypothetical protein